jgi:hypothetical protein
MSFAHPAQKVVLELQFEASLGKGSVKPSRKSKLKIKKNASMAQVVEHLPSKHKTLTSIPNTAEKMLFILNK